MLAFIDVSGDPYSKGKNSPWIVTGVLCVRKTAVSHMTMALYKLKKEILGNSYIEIKSTDLINNSTLSHPELNKCIFIDNIMHTVLDSSDFNFAAVIFKNTNENRKSEETYLPNHYRDSLWKIEAIAKEWRKRDVIVCIDNNNRKVDRLLAISFNNYLFKSAGGQQLPSILPHPILADSETSAGLQLVDMIAGIIRQYHMQHDDQLKEKKSFDVTALQKLDEYYGIIKHHSITTRKIETYNITGLHICPSHYTT